MNISNIEHAKEQRDRVREVADWVVEHVPWAIAVPDWPEFADHWSVLTSSELAAVEAELQRRAEMICAKAADLDGIAAGLIGRQERWSAAANWLLQRYPDADIRDPEFVAGFSDLTRAELMLAAIDHKRRLLRRAVS